MRPVSVMIKPVSGACNLRCDYCFYTDEMAHRETPVYPRMTLETLETTIRRIFRFADGPVSITLQGGEPTLIGLAFLEALVRFEGSFSTRGLPVTNALQTNGCALTDEMIAFFAREKFLLGISMDGIRETHDRFRRDAQGRPTWQTVCDSLRRLQAAGVEFNLLCVVNEYVAQRPREVFSALAPYGYLQFIACLDGFDGVRRDYSLTPERYLSFLKTTFDLYDAAFLTGHPVSVRNFDNYIQMLLGMPPENCAMRGQCGRYFLIESDGGVYPCDFYVLDEWRLGSILETPLNRLEHTPRAIEFRERSLPLPEKCRACRWRGLCNNGCRRERDPETGLNRWCACNQAFFEYAYPRMAELAKLWRRRGQG